MKIKGYSEPGTADYIRAGIYILLTIGFIIATILLLSRSFGMYGFLIWIILMVPLAIFILVRWHARNTAYRCPECGNEFNIGTFRDMVTPHNLNKFYLKCPRCGRWHWTAVLTKDDKGVV